MADDRNPLWRPNLEAIGRKDGYEGHKPRRNFITDAKYRDAYSDGRAKKIDEELKAMGSKPSAWGFGNAGSGYEQRSGCSLWTIMPPAGLLLALCLGRWS